MEKFKSPKGNTRFTKEIKNIKIKSKDNESFHYSKSPNVGKNHSYKEIISVKNKKKSGKSDVLNPPNNKPNIKENDKQVITQTKNRNDNTVKEKKLSNIPNKGKGRSLERVPLENSNRNKNNNNNLDLNKKKKFVIDIGKKNQKKNNSVGKNNNKNKNKKNNNNNNNNINKSVNNNNITEQTKKNQLNNNNNKNIKKEDLNIDNMKNININEEKSNQIKNNYINYNIINNNISSSEEDNIPFKKYNSVCVSINNNYNYNVSLGKPPHTENYDNFINQTFFKTSMDTNNNIKNKENEANWKEKILKINKQKNDINYIDYKKLSNTDSNFWNRKNESNTKNEDKKALNNTDNNNSITLSVKQKIKKVNSSIIPGNANKEKSENIGDKKDEPKKKNGILGFLRAFKDMLEPFNLRKRNSKNNTEQNNNSANLIKSDIKEKLNKTDCNNRNNYNNNNNLDTKKNLLNNYNTVNTTKVDINNNINNNNNNNVYEKTNMNMNMNKKDDEINYNYFSDSAYDSCPISKNPKNLNIYKSPIINKNINKINPNNTQILSYSHKNIMKNNNSYNNDIHIKPKVESSSDLINKKNQPYKNFKTEETTNNSNSLFNFFGIKNNKIYKKANNNNNFNNNIYIKNIPSPLNDINYNSAYIKKTKKMIFSPSISSKSENINEYKNNIDNWSNINNEKEIRRFSFNNNNINKNNDNNYNINLNNINIEKENKNKPLDKQKLLENYEKEKYNSENINENLNINAEKKIQEIKINIGNKKKNFKNTINYPSRRPANYDFMNNDMNNNNNKKLYNTMDDFLPSPKPKTVIESCIINFDKNKNKPMKIYENTLYNNKVNTPINNNINIENNNNYNLINNFNKNPLADNYNSLSYSNIHDVNNFNNNFKNVYSKPNNKNNNLNLTDSNNNLRREKNLSSMNLNIDIYNNNLNSNSLRPIKKKKFLNKNEKIHKINRLADSEEFDNDINSVNSDSSSNTSNNEFNRTQFLPNSNSIYTKPFKTYIINNDKSNSANNSFENIYTKDNSKYNTDFMINYNSDRELNTTTPGFSKSNKNVTKNLYDLFPYNNNNNMIYMNKNDNLNNTDINIYQNNRNDNLNNTDIEIYQDNNNFNNISSIGNMIYSKKPNSSKNNRVLAINDITPIPSNNYNLVNDININNIRPIIRPKVKQKNIQFIRKLYNYGLKLPKQIELDYYFSRANLEIFKLPLKQLSYYTKHYYKIIQTPIIKNNYISKKRIKNKEGINLPISQNCCFIKKNRIIYILNNNFKKKISEEIKTQFNDEALYKLTIDASKVEESNAEKNKSSDINNDKKEETQINLEKELEEKVEIAELENNNTQTININDELEINNNKKYSTPTQNIKDIEENQVESPKFGCSKSEYNPAKSGQNKIISIEIQLNNKDKIINKNDINDINKNLASSYSNMPINKNEPLYIKKKPSINNFINKNTNKNTNKNNNINTNNNNIIYYNTEEDKKKTYVKQRKNPNNEIKINNFYADDSNIYQNNYKRKSNKIICIDIDLGKEQKKLQEQKEAKEIKTYKRPTLAPLFEPTKNLKNKIDTITINYKQNSNNNNNINNIRNNLNNDKIKQEIIFKLEIISENNLLLIVEQFLDLLTKKVIIDNINNNLNYNKIRLSFMEILTNEYTFSEIITNKVITEINKIKIYANLCYELCNRLTNEINFRGDDTEEDLKTILAEECKLKFEEIIMDNNYNYNNNDNKLFGIIFFICELINCRIISLDIGYFCFEKLCNKYNGLLYETGNINKYYYLDMIVELLKKYGKIIYYEKNLKYLERIDNYVDSELNNIINTDMGLPEILRSKIINLINTKRNQWVY